LRSTFRTCSLQTDSSSALALRLRRAASRPGARGKGRGGWSEGGTWASTSVSRGGRAHLSLRVLTAQNHPHGYWKDSSGISPRPSFSPSGRHLSPLRSVVLPGRHVAGLGWRESWQTARFTTRNHTHILAPFCWAEVQMQTLQQAASSLHADAPPSSKEPMQGLQATQGCRRRLAAVIGYWACMCTRRTTRRAQVHQAHAVVIGALLSALARRIDRRCRQMRLAACLACIRRVSPLRHTIPHNYSAHGHMQWRAYMRALADVYIRNVAYAHSTSHTCTSCRRSSLSATLRLGRRESDFALQRPVKCA
jgi:hypothetical protein